LWNDYDYPPIPLTTETKEGNATTSGALSVKITCDCSKIDSDVYIATPEVKVPELCQGESAFSANSSILSNVPKWDYPTHCPDWEYEVEVATRSPDTTKLSITNKINLVIDTRLEMGNT
jgi:hypothetical protein